MNDLFSNNIFELLTAFTVFITLVLALVLDRFLGEPKKYHPLIGFGLLANFIEKKFNNTLSEQVALVALGAEHSAEIKNDKDKPASSNKLSRHLISRGVIAWCLLVLPLPLIYWYYFSDIATLILASLPQHLQNDDAISSINQWAWCIQLLLDGIVLYLAIGMTSLKEHAEQIYQPLQNNNLEQARHFTGYLVSRNTAELTPAQMSRATVESVLENGHDAVLASLIYYIIGGVPLVLLHRLANTLDAMWGYKNQQFRSFGYTAAKLDDVLGFVTGKCSSALYAIQGRFFLAMKNAAKQGRKYKSHNGGWVMAAGATVMKRTLGGTAVYDGKTMHSASLGLGKAPVTEDIPISVTVVQAACLWLLVLVFSYQLMNYSSLN